MTAWKQDAGKPRMDLVPHELPQGVADVLAFGAGKYGPRNWERGMDWGRVFGALQRHLWAFWGGEDRDPETGLPHTHHAACCIAFLMAYEARRIGVDDRPRRAPATLPNENLPVAAHIARRDAERAAAGAYTWADGKAVKLDADHQPLEWSADAIGSPPDGVCDVPAPHAAESAEGPPAARVCGGCYYADFRACCGISGLFVDMDDTCDNWQPRSDLTGLAARDNAIHPKEGRDHG